MEFTWYGIVLFLSGLVSVGIGQYVWHRRIDPESFWFSLLMHSISFWTVFSAFEAITKTLILKIVYSTVSYVGISTVSTLWFLLSARYQGKTRWFGRKYQAALWTIPVFVMFTALTNEWHGLLWSSITPIPGTKGLVVRYSHGPLVYVYVVYSYCLLAAGTAGFLRMVFRMPPLFSRQGAVLSAAVLFPWAANFFYIAKLGPPGIDLTPAAFCVTGVLFFLGLQRYRLFDVAPVAHDVLFRVMRDEVLVVDGRGRLVDVNPAAQASFGIVPGDIGRGVDSLFADWPELAAKCPPASGDDVGPVFWETRHGPSWFDVSMTPLEAVGRSNPGRLLVFRDITSRKRLEEELYQFASMDNLTGVYNRRVGLSILDQQIRLSERNGSPLTICYLDINDLKRVNDFYGHAEGDSYIRKISSVLKETMRESDVLSRLGGDEFLAILPECRIDQATAVWKRFEERLVEESSRDGKSLPYRAAHGFAEYHPGEEVGYEELLSVADAAMYRDKVIAKSGNAS